MRGVRKGVAGSGAHWEDTQEREGASSLREGGGGHGREVAAGGGGGSGGAATAAGEPCPEHHAAALQGLRAADGAAAGATQRGPPAVGNQVAGAARGERLGAGCSQGGAAGKGAHSCTPGHRAAAPGHQGVVAPDLALPLPGQDATRRGEGAMPAMPVALGVLAQAASRVRDVHLGPAVRLTPAVQVAPAEEARVALVYRFLHDRLVLRDLHAPRNWSAWTEPNRRRMVRYLRRNHSPKKKCLRNTATKRKTNVARMHEMQQIWWQC